jgi:hypothetical protein
MFAGVGVHRRPHAHLHVLSAVVEHRCSRNKRAQQLRGARRQAWVGEKVASDPELK